MSTVAAIITAIVAALGGASGIGVIIKQLVEAAKVRAEGKKISEDGHKKTQEMLAKLQASQAEITAKLQEENTQLRGEVERLKRDNAKLLDRVPPAVKPVKP